MRILFATDLSTPAERARDLVRDVRWPEGTVIRAVSVIEPYGAFVGLSPETIVEFDDIAVKDAAEQLDALAKTLVRPGLTVERDVLIGRPADQLVAEAKEFAADLVVIGSRGRGPFRTTLLGSVSAEVVDRAPCPVLVARTSAFTKLVVAEDGTPGAKDAVDLVATLPIFKGLQAIVVSVANVATPWTVGAEPPMLYSAAVEAYFETLDQQRETSGRLAATTAERLTQAGLSAKSKTREGHAAGELVAEAEAEKADLIVIGSRGHTGVARLLLGSVARAVLTHAHCSVLIVHAQPTKAKPGPKSAASVPPHA
ncbi:MAG: universal stress protein [Candidatus Limnocylindria bacterium]|nr:universal stress protein [Candidatus Limnocylindria bacterium]